MAQHLGATNAGDETVLTIDADDSTRSNRRGVIVNVIKRLAVLDDERRAISSQIAEIKQKEIKGELGMKISDFNVARRLYLLEGEDRREMLATLRETFDALDIGEQLDFIGAMAGHA